MDSEPTDPQHQKRGFRLPAADGVALVLAIFCAGGVLGALGGSPFRELGEGARDTVRLVQEMRQTRWKLLEPPVWPGAGVVTHDPSKANEGYTLIQGLLPGGPGVLLIDMDGQEVHRWDVDYFDIWANANTDHIVPHENIPKSRFHYHIQGLWPLSDGSIVVNLSEVGSVRLDRCSEPVWRLDRMTHHSVTPTSDGKYWIPAHVSVYETPEELFPGGVNADWMAERLIGTGASYNNSIILVNDKGEVEKEFSILQAIFDAGLEHDLYSSLTDDLSDATHINDIEVVTQALADKIDDVVPGDLLVSVRAMSMLAIVDQTDGHLKWHRQGPWLRQHDVDITPDGMIEIFNNRSKSIGDYVTTSQILSYDPATQDVDILHPVGPDDNFYTAIMGTHQTLENGNRLITESTAGRIFEVTQQGEVVWDYRLPYDDETTSLFEVGMRVPYDYFDIDSWTCEEQ